MALSNPLIPVGTLNRLRQSVTVPAFPQLNVTASFLGKPGIKFAREGEATAFLPAMVGAVTSPEPYILGDLTIALLKTMPVAQIYENQMISNALIRTVVARTDTSLLGPYNLMNCSIQTVTELSFAGDDPLYVVHIKGTYFLNSSLFNAA